MLAKNSRVVICLTWLSRIIFGTTFIISGFVKAIDPWGTIYKVDDYLSVLDIDIWPNLKIVGVFTLCALEFFIGVMILSGCFRKSVSLIGALFMAFMLPFSLWIALSDPVADCGCFGEAFILTNWETFWKNVVLSIMAGWLLFYNKCCRSLVTPALQWLAFVTTALFIVSIELFGYIVQPLIDFRKYPEGSTLIDTSEEDGDPSYLFVYTRNGETMEIDEDDEIPSEDEGWTFAGRKEISESPTFSHNDNSEKTFRVWSLDGNEDVSEDVIKEGGSQIIVMFPNISDTSISVSWKLNSMNTWAKKHNIDFIGVASGSEEEIADWEDLSMMSYPLYTSDDTSIKEAVRGNPGVIFLENGIIRWKSTLRAIDVDDFMAPGTSDDPMIFHRDYHSILRNVSLIYISVMTMLIVLSLLPAIKRMYLAGNRERITDGGKAHLS